VRAGVERLSQIQDEFYILASSSRLDDRTRVLKHGDTFAVFDRYGEMAPVGLGELGLYHDGTRFLSRLGLTIGGQRLLLLSSTVTHDNTRLVVDLTNADLEIEDRILIPRGTVHVKREILLWKGVCYERLRVANHGAGTAAFSLSFTLDADFADIFEVRGVRRAATGTRHPRSREDRALAFTYDGLDGVRRITCIRFSENPAIVDENEIRFDVELANHRHWNLSVSYACEIDALRPEVVAYDYALETLEMDLEAARREDCEIVTSNGAFNEWIQRSISDLHMMVTETPEGPYPYAGAPWFSTPFGRDGILTALEMLWVNPEIARGVLCFLAATQSDTTDPSRDAQPGKILHEARGGEMAALGEVPFRRYYGSIDATPLFVLLAGAYYNRTGDRDLIERLWPNIRRALDWMNESGDPDGDGFLEYARMSSSGLVQQGWKDSHDSVFHRDGTLAQGPIALCEVQGYAYAARRGAGRLAGVLGFRDQEDGLHRSAERLRDRFEEAFWCEDLSTYALALDGKKDPCRVRTSNPGHCLFTGIADAARAARVARGLLEEDCFTGWGVRTLSSSEVRYNPMSYHNGSVWPHDNAILAAGAARYGLTGVALLLLEGLFESSEHFDLRRTPELFCGFPRAVDSGPILYPVACAPQSWAAAAAFLMLRSCLGLKLDGVRKRISLERPVLPEFLEQVLLRNIRFDGASVDLVLERGRQGVTVSVLRREGPVDVLVSM